MSLIRITNLLDGEKWQRVRSMPDATTRTSILFKTININTSINIIQVMKNINNDN